MKRAWEPLKNLGIALGFITAATILGAFFRYWNLHETNIVIVYLLSVLFTARFTKGYFYGILAAILSFLLFNWFFTEPFYSLKINDPTYIMTIIIMSITATITSALTTKVKQAAVEAREKEAESNALYQMTNHLTDAEDSEQIAAIIVRTVSRVLSCHAGFVCYDENGVLAGSFIQQKEDGQLIHRELEDPQAFARRMASIRTAYDIGPEFYDFPVYGRTAMLAVLRIPRQCGENLSEAQNRILHSMIENASLALDRFRSFENQSKIREEAVQERYRGNLLRAISHDLRTPLSGIMGTSEMLMGMTGRDDPRYSLARDIYEDADWLHGLVENILNLTKFQDGHLTLHKEAEVPEEVIGAALMVLEKRMPDREIQVSIPDAVFLIPMDPRLITQVLVNLLDNAAKHTPPEREISVTVEKQEDTARFLVADRGTGIPEDALPKIFQMFFTTSQQEPSAKRGVGLGLAICQSIVEAHGGQINARNRDGGGAEFIFTLPLGGDAA